MGLRATMASNERRMRSATSLRLKAAASAKLAAEKGWAGTEASASGRAPPAREAEPGRRPNVEGGRSCASALLGGALQQTGRGGDDNRWLPRLYWCMWAMRLVHVGDQVHMIELKAGKEGEWRRP